MSGKRIKIIRKLYNEYKYRIKTKPITWKKYKRFYREVVHPRYMEIRRNDRGSKHLIRG